MASITSLGVGSGLELETLVTNLMTAEKTPLTTLKSKQSAYNVKISALGTLNSALTSLQSAASAMKPGTLETAASKFATYQATVANTAIASATASTGAVAGKYALEVDQLASGQQIKTAFTGKTSTTVVSTSASTLTLDLGSLDTLGTTYTSNNSFSISLEAGATLADLRDAINDSDAGVSASIINGTDGAQLVLTGPDGASNVMKLSGSIAELDDFAYDPTGVGSSPYFSQNIAAQDAEFTLNGIAATSSSNTVTDALDGVTLNLIAETEGTPTTVTIIKDSSTSITTALKAFVASYNAANSTMSSLGAYNADTKTAGNLQGNSTLRMAMTQIRHTVFDVTAGDATSAYQTLSNIGISVGKDGSLSLDSTKLTAALTADPATVANLVANVGTAFDTTIENLVGDSGSITSAVDGLKTSVGRLADQQDRLQTRLDAVEKRYRAQFAALDTLIAQLNSSGDYITSFISSLNSSD